MKLRKILSMAVTVAMVMTSIAVIALPAVSAETVNTSTEYFTDFNEWSLTTEVGGQQTMQNLYAAGWFPVDNTRYYTMNQFEKFADAGTQFVSVIADPSDSTNRYLKIDRPTIPDAPDNSVFGLGRAFPGQGTNTKTTGIWEINFDFKPTASPGQFNFGFNTMDGSASGTDVQHNIISAYKAKMYLGHRNYMTLYSCNSSVDTIAAANAWFKMRVIVDCDNHYYTVEIYNSAGQLGARRSAISFAGNESVGFFKMSALGLAGSASTVYVDNVRIRRQTARETVIYNETFDKIGSVRLASSDMTTGGATEDYAGNSYFVGNTPWRAHSGVGNSHAFETDGTLNSKVVRLGDLSGTDNIEASGLVYMPVLEKLVDSTTQDVRGKVKLSFKIKPETVVGDYGVSVNAIADHTQNINDNSKMVFAIGNKNNITALYKDSGSMTLTASKWYNVEMLFDVSKHTVTTIAKDMATNASLSFTRSYSWLTALKGLMFKVHGGSSVLMDDIKLEYYELPPSINASSVVLTDAFGNVISDTNNVTPALASIKIPVGCKLDNNTASAATIKLTDSEGTEITYEPSRVDKAYTLILNSSTLTTILEPGTEYTVTVPATLANFLGTQLGTEFTYKFTTASELPRTIDIGDITVGGTKVTALSNITASSEINVTIKYANTSNEAVNGTAIVVFYENGKVVKALTNDVSAKADKVGATNLTFEVPSDLNMNGVDAVSVLLWDNFTDITPQCPAVNFPNN